MPDTTLAPVDPAVLHRAVADTYWNQTLASVNDHEVRMSVMTHAFGWHRHPDSDETFLVLEGELVLTLQDAEHVLTRGQMLTVPRDTLHKTRPGGSRSVNLTFERKDARTEFVDR